MSDLLNLQFLFAQYIALLMTWIYAQGWTLTVGDFDRPDFQGHMANSCHYVRLAADLNLFVNGVWITQDSPEWQAIGAQWKSYHALCRWGGDFKPPTRVDQNHFSMEWEGRM